MKTVIDQKTSSELSKITICCLSYLMELEKAKICNHTEPLLILITYQATP